MKDKKIAKKVSQEADRVSKDFNALVKDATVQLNKFEDQANQAAGKAKADLTAKVDDGVSQLSKEYEKLMDNASTVKKDVGHRLSRVNAKAQKIIHKKSNDSARKAAIYSWVAVSLALMIGFGMFILLRPVRQPVG